jgi:hypothetical protein
MEDRVAKNLSAEASKLLDELDYVFDNAVSEARKKTAVLRSHIQQPFEGTLRCLRCDCKEIMPGPIGSGGFIRCVRPGCGHGFFSHDVG